MRRIDRALGRRAATALAGVAALCAPSVLVTGLAAGPSAHADDLHDRQDKVSERVDHADHALDESSTELRSATRALDRAEGKLAAATSRLVDTRGQLTTARILDQQMQAALEAAVRHLHTVQAQLVEQRRKIAGEQAVLGQIAVDNYQNGDPELMGLVMVLDSQDPSALTSQLGTVHNLMDRESATLDRLDAARLLLGIKVAEVAEAQARVAEKRRQAAANLVRKEALERQAEREQAQVQRFVSFRDAAHDRAARARAADLAVLQEAKQRQAHIAAVLRQRAEAARARALAQHARLAAPSPSGGYLSNPVSGAYITSPFGYRIHPIYGYRSLHDGVDFSTGRCGSPLLAAASGNVVSEYYQTAYGNRLVLDLGYVHGRGLAVVYNHAIRYTVGPGEHVTRGQVIGYLGTTGWSTGCHLHFTVLANGVPVDPMGWL